MLRLEDGTRLFGTNDEASPCMAGAICAERAALLQYRLRTADVMPPMPKIVAVYIVSDHPTEAIPPGCLCREYLYGHAAVDPVHTRIVLQSSSAAAARMSRRGGGGGGGGESPPPFVQVRSLVELYPYPSVTARCRTTADAMQRSQRLAPLLHAWWATATATNHNQPPTHADVLCHATGLSWGEIRRLVVAAHQAAVELTPALDSIYPIRYGAAAVVTTVTTTTTTAAAVVPAKPPPDDDDTHQEEEQPKRPLQSPPLPPEQTRVVTATHLPALEYGCSQDAVCRLLASIPPVTHTQTQDVTTTTKNNNNIFAEDDTAVVAPPVGCTTITTTTTTTSTIRAVVQVDQWGIVHAPFATARSLLVEHGYGTCPVLVLIAVYANDEEIMDAHPKDSVAGSIRVEAVPASTLAPWVPAIFPGGSESGVCGKG